MKKFRLNQAVKPIIIPAIVTLAIILIAGYTFRFVNGSSYFKIKEIVSKEAVSVDALSYLKGKPIFSVKLRRESRYLSQFFPQYKSVRLFRLLPNRIFVDFMKRTPLAQIKLYKNFNVDEDGVLFYPSREEDSLLPVISGLETKIFGPKPGAKYSAKELLSALNIIKEINKNKVFRNHSVKRIDVSGTAGASLDLSVSQDKRTLEVRLGLENIKEKIVLLSRIVSAAGKELANIKYIDLRFKEPVIKLQDAK